MSTITMILNGRPTGRSKHIDNRFFHIAELVKNKDIQLQHLASNLMVPDIFTKPLEGSRFNELRSKLLNDQTEATADEAWPTVKKRVQVIKPRLDHELQKPQHGLRAVLRNDDPN
jgi:hypothetical protein